MSQRAACFIDKAFCYTCSRAELCCHESFKTYIIILFSDKKQNYWYWDYSPQVLDYQEFWTIRHWISEVCNVCVCVCVCIYIMALCRVCVWCVHTHVHVCECACVLHTVSPSWHLIHISWMLVSQLSHFTVAVGPDQALSTVPFLWLSSNHILCKPHPRHNHFIFEV